MDAKKETHRKEDAIRVLGKASKLLAARGKKVVEVDLKKTELTEDEILKLVLGPTGNLRAPTLLVGKKMIVGFNEEMYESVFA
ncbi:ArsC family (seleno)protein [Mariniblastus fucicola]|uniref:ArsC family protein n=1 Tax=Mariniblastus fucicola TaxID=980251 RepID=A0A5B9P5Z3_9BACT|nr:ArsC family (seleno)protein [Mariniblastus fucicola]QEG20929.1 ArsC family protein [Mariniblastus fucicola]